MKEQELYTILKKVQEPKGYFFNKEQDRVDDLLKALLVNKERYGYMSCPCPPASRDRKLGQDIICPCLYRAQDVEEFGSCYCNLYVSKEWNESEGSHPYVPERRPQTRLPY